MTYYFDMDGVLANFHKEPYSYVNAINRQWIATLDPFVHNVNVLRRLICEGHECYIMSKAASENARMGKIDWLRKYVPEMQLAHIIIIVGNSKKVENMVTMDGMLIDDDSRNTRQWERQGFPVYLLQSKGENIAL